MRLVLRCQCRTLCVVPANAGTHSLRASKGNKRLPTYWRHGVWVPAFAGTALGVARCRANLAI